MKKLLTYLARQLTQNKDVRVTKRKEQDITVYTIEAPQEVLGLLIGKEGRIIKAIRSLAYAKAIVEKIKVKIQLLSLN
jgi:predicted RNA-binding protein YlqC (UPF0109 family)